MTQRPSDDCLLFPITEVPFDRISAEHVVPSIRYLIDTANRALDAIAEAPGEPTFDGTLMAMERATEQLEYAMGVVEHLESVASELRHQGRPGHAPGFLLSASMGLLAVVPDAFAAEQRSPADGPRSAPATAITTAIVVDGVLAEPAWHSAPNIGELIQRQPNPGAPPTERTEVTLLYDADTLYIGVVCFDSDPDRVLGTVMARDGVLTSDDRIQILLDTYRDQRNAFSFSTNAAGALSDALVFANAAGAAVPAGDVEAMSDALGRLLDDPEALSAARLGAERARDELTWDASAAAHLDLYRELA